MTDWDDAYNNRGYIPNAEEYLTKWPQKARSFRDEWKNSGQLELDQRYGEKERNLLDLFHPALCSSGLVVFVHGGYWLALSKSDWSHLANGQLQNGWSVCIPSYTLAPQARICEITKEIATAIEFAAARVSGPIRLAGHSAGGHLVTRMLCEDTLLSAETRNRITHILSISGLHDLRPLLETSMNQVLKLDEEEANTESPVFCKPATQSSLSCRVGAEERPEFLRQNGLLQKAWKDQNIDVQCKVVEKKHHFNIVEELADPNSEMIRELLESKPFAFA